MMKNSINIITGLIIGVLMEAALQFIGQLFGFAVPLVWALCTGILIVFSIVIGVSLACAEFRERKVERHED